MKHYIVRKLGTHRGSPRVFLDINVMEDAGFAPGRTYNREIDSDRKRLTLSLEPNGSFVVSRKEKSGKLLPVIDINNSKDLGMFEGHEAIRVVIEDRKIHILPIASEAKRAERLSRLKAGLELDSIKTGGISFGGGVLDHAAHAGLADAGIHAELALANEIDEDLLAHATSYNDIWCKTTLGIAAPMQELVQDHAAMGRLPQVDIFCGGIPCSGASKAGKSKRGLDMMESHPVVGHLVASALMIINRINPSVVVIENVAPYADTASAQILRHHLRDSGYEVQETVLAGKDFGALEDRVRWFLVAATKGITLDISDLAPAVRPVKRLNSVLENIPEDAADWRTFSYLKEKEVRDQERGNCFAMQVVTPESTSCPTLRKGYQKAGSTDPLLAHPTNPDLLRQFTVAEHARIKEIPEHLVNGLGVVAGHALLGQSVTYSSVRALFNRIGQSLSEWKDSVTHGHGHNASVPLLRAVG